MKQLSNYAAQGKHKSVTRMRYILSIWLSRCDSGTDSKVWMGEGERRAHDVSCTSVLHDRVYFSSSKFHMMKFYWLLGKLGSLYLRTTTLIEINPAKE